MLHCFPVHTPRFAYLALFASCLLPWVADAAEGWRAGAAAVVITPEKPMWMAGYASRTKPAEGKLTDLWAKALVLQDAAGNRALALTLDLVGIDRELSQSLCIKLQKKHKLSREQIAIFTSHTHSGPVVAKNLRPMHEFLLPPEQKQKIAAYGEFLESRVGEAVDQAFSRLAPAQVSWGSGTATYAVNRRTNKEAEVPELRKQGAVLKGPSDHDVPVLAVKDASGKLLAVLFGYACHATVLSGQEWCADHPGYAQIELESRHPGCIALFWAGCGGDQNPLPRRTVELAKNYGAQLANAVNTVLAKPLAKIKPHLATSYAEIPLALAHTPDREELAKEAADSNKYIAARAKMLLADWDRGVPPPATYPYPVGTWKLGNDVQFSILGGEVVVDYALRIKAELTEKRTWVAGYANDVMAYIPSRRVLTEGGYEGGGSMVYYGLPSHWAPDVEEKIIAEVRRQAGVKP